MKIACFGDSWTEGWGCSNKSWPLELRKYGFDVENHGKCGSINREIYDNFVEIPKEDYDLFVFGWSGATRVKEGDDFYEFCNVNQNRNKDLETAIKKRNEYFLSKSTYDIKKDWTECIHNINQFADKHQKKVIHFSVFGDLPNEKFNNFHEKSFLEILANDQNQYFKYTLPLFEYDFLNGDNIDLVTKFAKRNKFPSNWQKAIVEREEVRPGLNFFACGHPNISGHKILAKYIDKVIKNDLQ